MTYKMVENFVNETKGYQFGENVTDLEDWLLKDDGTPDMGKIYRLCQKEYGRCTSKVYLDRAGGPPIAHGWYFVKRMQYEDAKDNRPDSFYLRGVWVTVNEVVAPAIPETWEPVAV